MFEHFGYGCTVEDMITVYRDYRINTSEKRLEVFTRAMELASLLEKAMHGSMQALEEYKVNVNIQAIYALGCFGKPEEVEKLLKLVTMPKYYTQCLYAFGKAKIEGKLLYEKFSADVYYQSARTNLQVTAQALAMALRLDNGRRAVLAEKAGCLIRACKT